MLLGSRLAHPGKPARLLKLQSDCYTFPFTYTAGGVWELLRQRLDGAGMYGDICSICLNKGADRRDGTIPLGAGPASRHTSPLRASGDQAGSILGTRLTPFWDQADSSVRPG